MLIIMSKYTAKRSRCKVVSLHLLLFLIIFAVERKPELYAIVIILYTWCRPSMMAFTMESPIPLPPYSLVLALSTL